jgi:hypothetical protein
VIPLASDAPLLPWWPGVARMFGYRSRTSAYEAAHEGRVPLEFLPGPRGKLLVRTAELRRVVGLDEPERVAS